VISALSTSIILVEPSLPVNIGAVARAMKKYKVPGVAISSQGESSVSEGYVYEAINGASRERLPVLIG